ncbi:MAG: Hsp70 family protein [Umezawaea sp.]
MTETPVYGIDLGTTYTCIAHVDPLSGRPMITPNAEGDLITPSVVLFEDSDTRVVGREAKSTAMLDASRVVEMIKRQIGHGEWRREFFGREYSPEEISSYILRKVVDDAERHDTTRPHKVVITCPAYFGVVQRDATANAGRIAGLDVLEIINEPTAAAISYGMQDRTDQVVLVYDLGGGTFDVTVIKIEVGAITVVATDGAHELGGRNWDERVVQYLAEQWQAQSGSTSDPLESPETLQDLWQQAEMGKRALSAKGETRMRVVHDNQQLAVTLNREKFDELTRDLLDTTVVLTKKVMETARELGHPKVDRILLVGGSTKMVQVTERLKEKFDIEVTMVDPDQAVAKGAAIYGQKLAVGDRLRKVTAELDQDPARNGTSTREAAEELVASELGLRLDTVRHLDGMVVKNVLSHSFGVRSLTKDDKPVIYNLVRAQEPLPTEAMNVFGTRQAGMGEVELRIFENTVRDRLVEDFDTAEEVGCAVLKLVNDLPADSPVEVRFSINGQGRLHITGRDKATGGAEVNAIIETNRALSAEELNDAVEHAKSIRIIG